MIKGRTKTRSLLGQIVWLASLVLLASTVVTLGVIAVQLHSRESELVRSRGNNVAALLRTNVESESKSLQVQAQSIGRSAIFRAILGEGELDKETIADALESEMATFGYGLFRLQDSDGEVIAQGPASAVKNGLFRSFPMIAAGKTGFHHFRDNLLVLSVVQVGERMGSPILLTLGKLMSRETLVGQQRELRSTWLHTTSTDIYSVPPLSADQEKNLLRAAAEAPECTMLHGLGSPFEDRTQLCKVSLGANSGAASRWYVAQSLDREWSHLLGVLLRTALILGAGATTVVLLLRLLLPRWAVRPIRAVAKALTEFSTGDMGVDDDGNDVASFDEMREMLERISRRAEDTGRGRVGMGETNVEGDLTDAFQVTLANLQRLIRGVSGTVTQVEDAATIILTTLMASGTRITQSASIVKQASEKTYTKHEETVERILELAACATRIRELVEVIKKIAEKADILAINAGLEGARAGEAGLGFSIVAQEMRGLAEGVAAAAQAVKGLAVDIGEASTSAVEATRSGVVLAAEARMASEAISLAVRKQHLGLKEVGDDFAQSSLAGGGQVQVSSALRDLLQLSQGLRQQVAAFQGKEVTGGTPQNSQSAVAPAPSPATRDHKGA